jgi:hypothetical protein
MSAELIRDALGGGVLTSGAPFLTTDMSALGYDHQHDGQWALAAVALFADGDALATRCAIHVVDRAGRLCFIRAHAQRTGPF